MFLPEGQYVPSGYGATAVLAFRNPGVPTTASRARRMNFCLSYLSVFPSIGEVVPQPNQRMIVTVWPRRDIARPISVPRPPTEQRARAICAAAVDNYAYGEAETWIRAVPGYSSSFSGRGPFLIAFALNQEGRRYARPVLTFDLSNFDEPQTIQRALELWRDEVEADPSLWDEGGWSMNRLRTRIAAAAERYSETILSALKLVGVQIN